MTRITKCRIYLGTVFALGALLITWLLVAGGSPFYRYFLYHVSLPNFWVAINTIPYIIGIVLSRAFSALYLPDTTGYYIGLCAQWFFIGVLVSRLTCRSSE